MSDAENNAHDLSKPATFARKGIFDHMVNVWPTARKLLKQFQPGPAEHYTDILAAVRKQLEPPKRKTLKQQAAELRALYPVSINDAQLNLMWWRAKPLERLADYAEIYGQD